MINIAHTQNKIIRLSRTRNSALLTVSQAPSQIILVFHGVNDPKLISKFGLVISVLASKTQNHII